MFNQHNFKNIPCPFWIKKIIIHYLFYLPVVCYMYINNQYLIIVQKHSHNETMTVSTITMDAHPDNMGEVTI